MKYELKKHIDDLLESEWLYYTIDEKSGDIEFVTDEETIVSAAKSWKMSEEAVRDIKGSLQSLVEVIHDELSLDLEDIWNKVDG